MRPYVDWVDDKPIVAAPPRQIFLLALCGRVRIMMRANDAADKSTSTIEAKTMISNIATLETIVSIANIGVIIALALSFLSGGTSIIFSRMLTTAKAEQARIEKDISDTKIALANAEAAKANERIAIADEKIAAANEKAEHERLARIKLEVRLANRRLTNRQKEELVSAIRRFAGTDVDVVVWGDTAEIKTMGITLLDCLRTAGWNVTFANASGGFSAVTGILVGVRPGIEQHFLDAARTLTSELQSMGIDSGLWDFGQMEYPTVAVGNLKMNTPMKIFVGSKP